MKKFVYLGFLVAVSAVTCGFTWGFGRSDTCGEARNLVPNLAALSGEAAAKE
jgi:hypothetical protein